MSQDVTSYETFIRDLISNYIEHPDLLTVKAKSTGQSILVMVNVAPTDFGKVLGKQAKTFRALEILVYCKARIEGDRVSVQLIEPENRVPGGPRSEFSDPRWNGESGVEMARLLTKTIDRCLSIPAEVQIKPMNGETMLTIVPKDKPLPSEVVAALHTIFRAIGASVGRRIVVNAREGVTNK